MGEPGPAYIEIPTDVLRTHVPELVLDEWLAAKPPRRSAPDPERLARPWRRHPRREAPAGGHRPRRARGGRGGWCASSTPTDALYLDTQESRGLVPSDHPAFAAPCAVPPWAQADLVIVLGRKLDYQTAYGSPAVFPEARFLRISDTAGELTDNRRGMPGTAGSRRPALDAHDRGTGQRRRGPTPLAGGPARQAPQRIAEG
jgi:acetolactate synthase-1/2/3 large subunit